MGVVCYDGYGVAICGASYLCCSSESFLRAAQSKSSLEAPLPIRKVLARALRSSRESWVIILSHNGGSISPCHLSSSSAVALAMRPPVEKTRGLKAPGASGRLLFAVAAMVSRNLNALSVMWARGDVGLVVESAVEWVVELVVE